jgi:hypothetical protein
VARLAVAAGIAGVLTAGAAPALASNSINYYSGSASGQAVALQVNPHTVLDANLPALRTLIRQLDSAVPGISGTVTNSIGSTLEDPTAPINVTVDAASAKGIASKGTELTDGAASSTAVAIDARSLKSEVDLLNRAVKNMPSGTVAALQQVLGPIAAHNPDLKAALDTYLPSLAEPVTGALGSPTVDILRSVDAKFGEDVHGDITTVQQGGLLTPNSALKLQPFEARALASDAYAANTVDNLNLVPTGQLGVVSNLQVAHALTLIETELIKAEAVVTKATANRPVVGGVVSTITGNVFPVVNGTVGTVSSGVEGNVDLNKVNELINSISLLRSLLGGLDGLQLNDIVGNNGANALSGLSRTDDKVTANGLGNVAHVDVVKVNDPHLKALLGMIGAADLTELASIDGVKGTASVTLDGVHPATQSANGSLVDIRLLGRSLSYYAALAGQTVTLDDILPAGTTCQVNIPGTSTCHGIKLLVPVTGKLAAVNNLTDKLPTLLNVTLSRGLGVVDQAASTKYGRADITTLQLTTDLNCGAVKPIADALSSVQSSLDLGLTLAACGVGVGNASPTALAAARTAGAQQPRATDATVAAAKAHLVSLSLGVAHAEVNLNEGSLPNTPATVPSVPLKNTGNDLLILAGVSLAALAGGVALQARKARA